MKKSRFTETQIVSILIGADDAAVWGEGQGSGSKPYHGRTAG